MVQSKAARAAIHPVILCGGTGSRLWPMSRALYPKQLLALHGPRTMIQDTALRVAAEGFAPPLVICNHEHRFVVGEQMAQAELAPAALVLEPVGRNTAPAAAVAALLLAQTDPQAVMLLLPSDHVIEDAEAFRQAVAAALPAARDGRLVTFGILPSRPETGYGYIRRGAPLGEPVYQVASFVEKPGLETAKGYLAAGGYYWNSGMFLFRADILLAELEAFDPEMLALCRSAVAGAQRDLDFCRLDDAAFASIDGRSLDHAVMEHTSRAAVIPVDIGWNDVGAWSALWDLGAKDDGGNVLQGDVLCHDVRDSYIRSEKGLVAALGVDNLVIVQTGDAVLVAPRERSQQVKELVDALKAAGRIEQASHPTVYRPWGSYCTVEVGSRFQVKHITVKPGARLSLQMHHHRAEHWIVVAGTARVTCGEQTLILYENQSTYIPIGTLHRLENPGKIPLRLIEVQSGAYLGEDDIVRLEDTYGRA